MDNSKYIERLEKRGIKPTANRILVLEAMLAASRAVSLAELEGMLGTVDRSSIFRTLGHFLQNRLIHDIEDGSGSVKYEVCDSDSACSVADMHAHFFCEVCHRTYCLKKVQIPVTPKDSSCTRSITRSRASASDARKPADASPTVRRPFPARTRRRPGNRRICNPVAGTKGYLCPGNKKQPIKIHENENPYGPARLPGAGRLPRHGSA